jgi:hypothetical protein
MSTLYEGRLCGRRMAAGVYAETRSGPEGAPLESFIVDPPRAVDPVALGLSPIGVRLIQVGETWHLFDIVGETYYPLPADFVEEMRRSGSASRRLPASLDFSKLGRASRLVLIHRKAVFENYARFRLRIPCPAGIHRHPLPEMCAGLWWQDLPPQAPGLLGDWEVERRIGGLSYCGLTHPEGVGYAYRHGIFMILPLTHLVVIAGRSPEEEERARKNYEAAARSGLDVTWEEE